MNIREETQMFFLQQAELFLNMAEKFKEMKDLDGCMTCIDMGKWLQKRANSEGDAEVGK